MNNEVHDWNIFICWGRSGERARLWHCSKRVWTKVVLLRSLLDKYPGGERHEPLNPPAIVLNNSPRLIWYWNTQAKPNYFLGGEYKKLHS